MKDKVVLIVGGSGGIGSATAKLFAKAGAKIVLAARDKDKAEEVAKSINNNGGEAFVIQVDVTELSSVFEMVDTVVKELGQIDVLVNAFGVGLIQPIMDVNPKSAKNVFDVNVFGTFLVTQTVMRYMISRKEGSIVMIPGILGKAVRKNSSIYSASKYAVSGFTKALVEESRRTNIKFSLLYLGGVATDFWDNSEIDMRVQKEKMLTADEVAKAIYYACTQPGQSVLNEMVIQPDSHQMV
ncbi:MAG: SDR family oxidoreductase [Balneolales bacterium]|nr:SDR family oxidoreductase [Balneolales bacterium]